MWTTPPGIGFVGPATHIDDDRDLNAVDYAYAIVASDLTSLKTKNENWSGYGKTIKIAIKKKPTKLSNSLIKIFILIINTYICYYKAIAVNKIQTRKWG